MKFELTQRERLLTTLLYFSVLVLIYKVVGGDFNVVLGQSSSDKVIWFFSGALMIVLGKYLVETYFTKPSDALANSITALIALVGLSDKTAFWLYPVIFGYSILIFATSVFSIATKDALFPKLKLASQFAYRFVGIFGRAEVVFSVIYLSASYSYFARLGDTTSFIILIAFWIVLVFFDIGGLAIKSLFKLFSVLNKKAVEELGTAIGCENPFFYRVEIDLNKNFKAPDAKYGNLVAIETSQNIGSVGMVIDKKHLLSKRWLSIYLFRDSTGNLVKIDLRSKKIISDPKSIFSKTNCAYLIDMPSLGDTEQEIVRENLLYRERDSFVGYVTAGSNINTVNFSLIRDLGQETMCVSEGSILKTKIYNVDTLYQVLDGNTKEEHLQDFDSHGYVIGVAKKLGKYDFSKKELNTSKWLPPIYSPLFFAFPDTNQEAELERIATESIGRLPQTTLEIPINNFPALVTHNTAILGILGIGKSCLTHELIAKVIEKTSTQVICIDITNEYTEELTKYGLSVKELDADVINAGIASSYESINKDISKGGNHADFKTALEKEIAAFLAQNTDRILLLNPEDYAVSRQTSEVKAKKIGPGPNDWQDQAPMRDLSVAEITRIISEIALETCKSKGRTQDPRCLLVYEEAHSLVPEWSSTSNDGEEKASNGTAKVILQGRKYGLGCFLIAQRTANISKSILNQCNTIFALRIFDDTGKDFLANYIGKDYANTLPTLEERQAVAIGKGLKLKQPVIIELNDKKHLTEEE